MLFKQYINNKLVIAIKRMRTGTELKPQNALKNKYRTSTQVFSSRNKIQTKLNFEDTQELLKTPTQRKRTLLRKNNTTHFKQSEISEENNIEVKKEKMIQKNTSGTQSHPNLLTFSSFKKLKNYSPDKIKPCVEGLNTRERSKNLSRSMQKKPNFQQDSEIAKIQKNYDTVKKQPRKTRRFTRTAQDQEIKFCSPKKSVNSLVNSHISENKSFDNPQQIQYLKKDVQTSHSKISELTKQLEKLKVLKATQIMKNKNLSKELAQVSDKLKTKQGEIFQLKKQLNLKNVEISSLNEKIQELEAQINFKPQQTDCFSLGNQDHSVIDMTQTAEYLENFSDLEEQLHRKNNEIFSLNKKISQLQTQQHCEIQKHTQQLNTVQKRWVDKYFSLLDSYKELKNKMANINKANKMNNKPNKKKQQQDLLLLETERDSIFDLSMSVL